MRSHGLFSLNINTRKCSGNRRKTLTPATPKNGGNRKEIWYRFSQNMCTAARRRSDVVVRGAYRSTWICFYYIQHTFHHICRRWMDASQGGWQWQECSFIMLARETVAPQTSGITMVCIKVEQHLLMQRQYILLPHIWFRANR